MAKLRDHFVSRQHELLALTCALVEAESPSGDKDGSSAVVSLLANAAGSINAVSSVERITSEEFGEHLRWAHRYGSPTRRNQRATVAGGRKSHLRSGYFRYEGELRAGAGSTARLRGD